jgi:hypothetical protein
MPKGLRVTLSGLSIVGDLLTTSRASAGTPVQAVVDEPGLLFSTYSRRFGLDTDADPCGATIAPGLSALMRGQGEDARLFRANLDVWSDASLAMLHPETPESVACLNERAASPKALDSPSCDPSVATCLRGFTPEANSGI